MICIQESGCLSIPWRLCPSRMKPIVIIISCIANTAQMTWLFLLQAMLRAAFSRWYVTDRRPLLLGSDLLQIFWVLEKLGGAPGRWPVTCRSDRTLRARTI